MKITEEYTQIKKRKRKKRKETVTDYHLLSYMCWCAVTNLMQKPKGWIGIAAKPHAWYHYPCYILVQF